MLANASFLCRSGGFQQDDADPAIPGVLGIELDQEILIGVPDDPGDPFGFNPVGL